MPCKVRSRSKGVVCALLSGLFFALIFQSVAYAEPEVKGLEGTASIAAAGQKDAKKINKGAKLAVGDTIITHSGTKAWVSGAAFETSDLALAADTRFLLEDEKKVGPSRSFVGRVEQGIARFILTVPETDPPSSFTVKTPTAVITVVQEASGRITDFVVSVFKQRHTTVTVIRGAVKVVHADRKFTGEAVLRPCESVPVKEGEQISGVRAVSTEGLKALVSVTTIPGALPEDCPDCALVASERRSGEIPPSGLPSGEIPPGVTPPYQPPSDVPPPGWPPPPPAPPPPPPPPPPPTCPCPNGQEEDGKGGCKPCTQGQTWNPQTCKCEGAVPPTKCPCPNGQEGDGKGGCKPCTQGQTWNPQTCKCEGAGKPPSKPCKCPQGEEDDGKGGCRKCGNFEAWDLGTCKCLAQANVGKACNSDGECGRCGKCVAGICKMLINDYSTEHSTWTEKHGEKCPKGKRLSLASCECLPDPEDGKCAATDAQGKPYDVNARCKYCEECKSGRCQPAKTECASGYHFDAGVCGCKKEDQSCSSNSDCMLGQVNFGPALTGPNDPRHGKCREGKCEYAWCHWAHGWHSLEEYGIKGVKQVVCARPPCSKKDECHKCSECWKEKDKKIGRCSIPGERCYEGQDLKWDTCECIGEPYASASACPHAGVCIQIGSQYGARYEDDGEIINCIEESIFARAIKRCPSCCRSDGKQGKCTIVDCGKYACPPEETKGKSTEKFICVKCLEAPPCPKGKVPFGYGCECHRVEDGGIRRKLPLDDCRCGSSTGEKDENGRPICCTSEGYFRQAYEPHPCYTEEGKCGKCEIVDCGKVPCPEKTEGKTDRKYVCTRCVESPPCPEGKVRNERCECVPVGAAPPPPCKTHEGCRASTAGKAPCCLDGKCVGLAAMPPCPSGQQRNNKCECVPLRCSTDKDCPLKKPCCKDGQCREKQSCPDGTHKCECPRVDQPPAVVEPQPAGRCKSDADCPLKTPCCKNGQCREKQSCPDGTRRCECPRVDQPPSVVEPQPSGRCKSDADCPLKTPCCTDGQCREKQRCPDGTRRCTCPDLKEPPPPPPPGQPCPDGWTRDQFGICLPQCGPDQYRGRDGKCHNRGEPGGPCGPGEYRGPDGKCRSDPASECRKKGWIWRNGRCERPDDKTECPYCTKPADTKRGRQCIPCGHIQMDCAPGGGCQPRKAPPPPKCGPDQYLGPDGKCHTRDKVKPPPPPPPPPKPPCPPGQVWSERHKVCMPAVIK